VALAARFPAFSSTVYRSLLEAPGPAGSVEFCRFEKLRIRLFQHAGTQVAQNGRTYLRSLKDVAMLGPWPTVPLQRPQFIAELAEQLWSGGSRAGTDDSRIVRDHVQYFACHCETERPNSGDYGLLLAHDRGFLPWYRATNVTLRELHQALGRLPERVAPGPLPLVFLNACGGARITPSGATSFPNLFLDNDNCCIIAAETPVQDDFADLFAREFYDHLLTLKHSGQALFQARWALLKIKRNPQGMVYSMYGTPDVRIA
jgi:hypothetical protein